MERFIKSPIVNYILYICNALIVFFGFLLAIVGIVMCNIIGDLTKYPNASDIKTLPTLVILLGVFTVAVALIGCFGIYTEKTVFITIYAGATLILFILQFAMVSWLFVNVKKYPNLMSDLVTMAWLDNNPQNKYPMDILQIQFDCCGRYDASDYINANIKVPNSCCGDWILIDCPGKVYLTKPGCRNEFHIFWTYNNSIIRSVGVVLVLVQLIAMFFIYHVVRTLQ